MYRKGRNFRFTIVLKDKGGDGSTGTRRKKRELAKDMETVLVEEGGITPEELDRLRELAQESGGWLPGLAAKLVRWAEELAAKQLAPERSKRIDDKKEIKSDETL